MAQHTSNIAELSRDLSNNDKYESQSVTEIIFVNRNCAHLYNGRQGTKIQRRVRATILRGRATLHVGRTCS